MSKKDKSPADDKTPKLKVARTTILSRREASGKAKVSDETKGRIIADLTRALEQAYDDLSGLYSSLDPDDATGDLEAIALGGLARIEKALAKVKAEGAK